jgi:hypothetical protein
MAAGGYGREDRHSTDARQMAEEANAKAKTEEEDDESKGSLSTSH